jgi:hypothetical protein
LPTGENGVVVSPYLARLNFFAVDDRQTIPIVRINPSYPRVPLQRGIEGWVEVEFTIGAAREVSNPGF